MSALAGSVKPAAEGAVDEPISVLIALPPTTDPASLNGLLRVLSQTKNDNDEPLFTFQTCGPDSVHQAVRAELSDSVANFLPTPVMTLAEACEDQLDDFDILIVPHLMDVPPVSAKADGGSFFGHSRRKSYSNADTVAVAPEDDVAGLIRHWAAIQRENATRERSLLTIGTATLSAARAGALRKLAASIHPSLLTKLELECQAATLAIDPDEERTMVIDNSVDPAGGWYVVSNGRFDIDSGRDADDDDEALDVVDDELPSPRITSRRSIGSGSAAGAPFQSLGSVTKAIPGSLGRRYSKQRESVTRRESLPAAGLRVITASESAAATDSALYLVAAMHSVDRAEKIAGMIGHDWRRGLTVGAVDV